MRKKAPLISGLAALLALAVAAGCGDDGPDGGTGPDGDGNGNGNGNPVVVSDDWAGIWNLTLTMRDCATNAVIETVMEVDTLCAEEFTADDEDFGDLDCTGTWTATSADVSCTGSFTLDGITCTYSATLTGSLSGDGSSYNASIRVDITYTGEGAPPDFCTVQEVSATRISDAQPGCNGSGAPPVWLRALDNALISSGL